MFNVLLFGTGEGANKIKEILDYNKVNIIAYIDNDKNKVGKLIDNKKIILPAEVEKYEYDYIIICSMFYNEINMQLLSLGVDKNKIFKPFYYTWGIDINAFNNKFKSFIECKDNLKIISTGISYINDALDVSLLRKKAFKFTMQSQDLYYDYKIVKYISEKYSEIFNNLENVIIGLSYYSFQYDMSKSSNCKLVVRYYEVLKTLHNYFNNDISSIIFEQIMKEEEEFDKFKNMFMKNSISLNFYNPSYKLDYDTGRDLAIADANKDYPYTVLENIDIFKRYLEMLICNKIKPVIVISPVTKYYYENFPKKVKEEFYSIIYKLQQQYDFQVLDYFDSEIFKDDDFYHVSHLNINGAARFTRILNEKIHW